MNFREEIAAKSNNLIAFVNWSGAKMESKKHKIIKELSEIRKLCKDTSSR